MIVVSMLCHECHARYETGRPDDGSDAIFFPNVEWAPSLACPRCGGDKLSVTLVPGSPVKDEP